MTNKPDQNGQPYHHQPDKVKCTENLTLDNDHTFEKGKDYDLFQTHHPLTPFCVGQNRVRLSQIDAETFNAHFDGSKITICSSPAAFE